MIRYPVSKSELEALIKAEAPKWLETARKRTEGFRKTGIYEEKGAIWSQVKAVYMRLQCEKCAYCEREMESIDFGRVEQDVEHFRPKGSVSAWETTTKLKGVSLTAPPAKKKGYHLLPYNIFNYAAACKPCNSTLKKDHFPIAGKYELDADDPSQLKSERAYLVYPLGDIDEDPERLIEFHGPSPRPVAKSGHARARAMVTIEFFKLDDPTTRKNLYRDRAIMIIALCAMLEATTKGAAAARAKAQKEVDAFLTPRLRHLNCARSFVRLFNADRAEAKAVRNAAMALMKSIS